jgi:hypothetical protein
LSRSRLDFKGRNKSRSRLQAGSQKTSFVNFV